MVFRRKKSELLGKMADLEVEQEMGKDTLRITCAEKEERYQRLLGPLRSMQEINKNRA